MVGCEKPKNSGPEPALLACLSLVGKGEGRRGGEEEGESERGREGERFPLSRIKLDPSQYHESSINTFQYSFTNYSRPFSCAFTHDCGEMQLQGTHP